jgi:hypothetical protein
VSFQALVGRDANGVLDAPLLQSLIQLRLGKGGISPESDLLPIRLLPLDLGQ